METRKIFKCFISSPSDCNTEREECKKVINELNSSFAKHLGVSLDTFMWEDDVLPDMGRSGQEIIDEYIKKSNYDIFIGIMKHRFGQPTQKAGSGTEHEFRDALERKKSSEKIPRIIFFFGKEEVDPDLVDFEQYNKVKNFKLGISAEGIYVDYSGIESFEENLKQKLKLFIEENSQFENAKKISNDIDGILKKLVSDLDESLTTYNEKTPVWIEPIISSKKDIPNNPNKNFEHKVEIESIIEKPENIVIKAPSEFGLTSLAHYIKLEAYKKGKIFVYIDSKKIKRNKIVNQIKKEVGNYYSTEFSKLDCILIDSVCFEENGVMQMIKNVCEEFKEIPLIIFNTLDNNFFLSSQEDEKIEIKRSFTSLYLLPLPQTELRKIVTTYSRDREIAEDYNVILDKVAKDLEVLNMHRTPKNCISILRASHKIGSDYGPINRTKLLDTILNTIFKNMRFPHIIVKNQM